MSSNMRLYLIDASVYFFRYYFSLPSNWQSDSGYPTESVMGYTNWLNRFLNGVNPKYVGVCFDESLGHCFRNELYPEYKSSRALPDENLAFQLQACQEITQMAGLQTFASSRYEADDLIASLAASYRKYNAAISVISIDKDLGQVIVTDDDQLWNYPDTPMSKHDIEQKLGVKTHQIADLLAMAGDAVDDIPGIPGIGVTAAKRLLAVYPSWGAIKQNAHTIGDLPIRGAARIQKCIADNIELGDISLQLARVYTRALKVGAKDLSRRAADKQALIEFSNYLGIQRACETSILAIPD